MTVSSDIPLDVDSPEAHAVISFFSAVEKKLDIFLAINFHDYCVDVVVEETGASAIHLIGMHAFSNMYSFIVYMLKTYGHVVFQCHTHNRHEYAIISYRLAVVDFSSPEAMKMCCDFGMMSCECISKL